MIGSRRNPSSRRGSSGHPTAFLLLVPLLGWGCAAATPEPAVEAPAVTGDTTAPAHDAAAAGAPAPSEAADPSPPASEPSPPPGDPTVIIIPSAEPDPQPQPSLVEAAAAARAQRAALPPPVLILTDENLHEHARHGKLTTAPAPEPTGGANNVEVAVADGEPAAVDPETYWRGRARTAREEWRRAVDATQTLQAEAARLRREFYATDDPVYRDTVVRPAWDLALADLAAHQAAIGAAREPLAGILEAGRRSGALPGGLREGVELEPSEPPPSRGSLPTVEPGEPPQAEEPR